MNIEAAKELLAHYKSLTLNELKFQWDKYMEEYECDYINGGNVLGEITGFGCTGSCPLCRACNTNCNQCIYSLGREYDGFGDFPCINESYHKIADALSADELYEALQYRIEGIENLLNASIA